MKTYLICVPATSKNDALYKRIETYCARMRGVEKTSDSFRVTCNSAWLARLTLFMQKGETLEIHCIR